jgi:adenosylcobinamide-phosphate synthase
MEFAVFCLGLRSLRDHNLPIQQALLDGDLATAQRLTSYIVSRDTDDADEEYLAKASVESVLENGCDAVFGTLFWFMLLGGAVLFYIVWQIRWTPCGVIVPAGFYALAAWRHVLTMA